MERNESPGFKRKGRNPTAMVNLTPLSQLGSQSARAPSTEAYSGTLRRTLTARPWLPVAHANHDPVVEIAAGTLDTRNKNDKLHAARLSYKPTVPKGVTRFFRRGEYLKEVEKLPPIRHPHNLVSPRLHPDTIQKESQADLQELDHFDRMLEMRDVLVPKNNLDPIISNWKGEKAAQALSAESSKVSLNQLPDKPGSPGEH